MPVLASVEVLPIDAQVAIIDRTWQDYPRWDSPDQAVAFRAPSLIDPDHSPCPGFAVATRPDHADGAWQHLVVEVWSGVRPVRLRKLYESILHVGRARLSVGNMDGLTSLDISSGDWLIEIWVDCEDQRKVGHVVFFLAAL